jgi:hypothetical protein
MIDIADGPRGSTVGSGNRLCLRDILVGEVWKRSWKGCRLLAFCEGELGLWRLHWCRISSSTGIYWLAEALTEHGGLVPERLGMVYSIWLPGSLRWSSISPLKLPMVVLDHLCALHAQRAILSMLFEVASPALEFVVRKVCIFASVHQECTEQRLYILHQLDKEASGSPAV